jgi:iron complex outermembrane receptor protein
MRPGRVTSRTKLAGTVALSAVVVALGGVPGVTLAAEGDAVEGVLLDTEGDEADDLFGGAPSDERVPEDPDAAATQSPAEEEEFFKDPLEDGSSQPIPPGIETIVIIGEKAVAFLEKETTSAVNFEPEFLRMEGIEDISDLSDFTPNLQINTAFAASNPTLFIRGIGLDDYNANSSSAVAVYQDGVYMNSPVGQLSQLFDVADITVLRGPQARMRNANAGAILITSFGPSDEFESYAEASYGNFNRLTVKGAVNIPILPEILSSRLSFVVNKGDGITKNRCHDGPGGVASGGCREADLPGGSNSVTTSGLDEFVNDIDNWAARGTLLHLMPIADEEIEWLLNVHGGKNNSGSAQFQHRGFTQQGIGDDAFPLVPGPDRNVPRYWDTDGDPFAGDYNAQGKEKISLFGGSLRVVWLASPALEVVSLSAFEWHDRDTLSNDDASPRVLFDRFQYRDTAWQFSEELTVHWLLGESGEFDFGSLFLMENLDVDNFFPNDRTAVFKPQVTQLYTQKTRSIAVYMHGRTELPSFGGITEFSNFALEGTVRYSMEFKDFEIDTVGKRGNLPEQVRDAAVSDRWGGISGDIALTYFLGRHFGNEDVSVYAKYSRGFKPGHFNGGTPFSIKTVEPVDEETVDSFEAGFHTSWFDQRLDVDLTYFHYDFEDMQVFQLQQEAVGVPLPRLVNAEAVKIDGVELELRAEPIDGLVLSLNAGWVKGEYEDFTTQIIVPAGFLNTKIITADYSGKQLLASPTWSGSASAQYTLELGWFGSLRPRYSVSYKDDTFFDPNEGAGQRGNLVPGTMGQEAYWVHNAMLTYTSPDQRIEVTGWVRNFLGEEYRVQSFDLTERSFHFVIDAYADPRTYGFTAVFRF